MENKCVRQSLIWWFLVAYVLSLVTSLSAFLIYNSIRSSHSTWSIIHFFCSYTLQSFLMSTTMTTFIALLMNLRHRFEALRTILRFELSDCHSKQIDSTKKNSFILIRKRFINGDTNDALPLLNRESSIATIKFIGKQHSVLTGIMDQINFCYSIQV